MVPADEKVSIVVKEDGVWRKIAMNAYKKEIVMGLKPLFYGCAKRHIWLQVYLGEFLKQVKLATANSLKKITVIYKQCAAFQSLLFLICCCLDAVSKSKSS